MKRIVITILFAFAVNAILAQTYNMKIKQETGTTYSVTSTVEEITFLNTTTTPFVCGDVILYGGETYPTILIGSSQCWFQKNLNIGTRIDGSSDQISDNGIEKYCYGDNNANCVTYGGLYQWNEAMQYGTNGAQGICPPGWHIPTKTEFETLKATVIDDGNALKALGPGTGTNTSGFSALLAGVRDYYIGEFNGLGADAYFWCSTEYDAARAYYMYLFATNITLDHYEKGYGFSVRCLKD